MLVACDGPTPTGPSAERIEALTQDAPQLFTTEPPQLEGLEGLYLGMPKEQALEVLSTMCTRLIELDGGRFRGGTYFRGCHTPNHPFLFSFRVGFHPKLNDAIFTLEVKRKPVEQDVVIARIWQKIEGIHTQMIRRAIVRVEAARFNVFADWDDGRDAPTHLLIGFSEAEIERRALATKH